MAAHDMRLYTRKLRAFSVHFTLSVAIALLAATLVFLLWFPYPYREISGGGELFILVVTADVALGPLMTFTVFNPSKSRREKLLDFSVIGFLQLGALCYGLWTVALARPVHLVFEYDRFRVVHAAEVPVDLLGKAPEGLQSLPWTGPTLLSLRPIKVSEQFDMTMAAFSGVPVSARPELWRPYAEGKEAVLAKARPAAELLTRFAAQAETVQAAIKETGIDQDDVVYLPLAARQDRFWTVLLNKQTAQPVGYLPLDSF